VVVQSERQHTLLDATASSIRGALELNARRFRWISSLPCCNRAGKPGGDHRAVTTEDILNKIFSGFCVGK
jgi:tRNA U34 5-carboxymethylaminomethyl modifying GTPase MnmE/TrmE